MRLSEVNWSNAESVIKYAQSLGRGQTVFKVPGRDNFNITHTSRVDMYNPEWVIKHV